MGSWGRESSLQIAVIAAVNAEIDTLVPDRSVCGATLELTFAGRCRCPSSNLDESSNLGRVADTINVVTNPPLTDQRRVIHLCHHFSSPYHHGSLKQLHNTSLLQIGDFGPFIHLPPLPPHPIPDNMRSPPPPPPPSNPRRIPLHDSKIIRLDD